MNTTKSPGAVAAHGASETDELARRVDSEISLHQIFTQAPINALLVGSDRCEAEGIKVRTAAPALALCRALIDAGFDPAGPLWAYRGDVVCLRIRSIGEGARLRVATHGVGFEPLPECTGGPPTRQNGGGGP